MRTMWLMVCWVVFASSACGGPVDGAVADVAPDAPAEGQGGDAVDVVAADDVSASCETSPCLSAEAPRCDPTREALWVPATPREGGAPVCDYPVDRESCGDGVCLLAECAPITRFCDFPFTDRLSRLTLLMPGGQSGTLDPDTGAPDDQCCFDFDGDGRMDNGLGRILKSLEPFLGSAAELQGAAVSRGPPVLDFHGLDSLVDDDAVDLTIYGAIPHPDSGGVEVRETGFAPGTARPPGALAGCIVDGVFRGEGGTYGYSITTGAEALFIELEAVRAELAVSPDPAGGPGIVVGGTGGRSWGKIGGLHARATFLAAFNRYAKEYCTCTVFGGSEDEPVIDLDTEQCVDPAAHAQDCEEPDSLCAILTGEYCAFLIGFFVPDVDMDGDGVPDRISVGYRTEGVPTHIAEIRGCE